MSIYNPIVIYIFMTRLCSVVLQELHCLPTFGMLVYILVFMNFFSSQSFVPQLSLVIEIRELKLKSNNNDQQQEDEEL